MTEQTVEQKFDAMRGSGRPESYHLKAGERVPSVTTILSRFKESGGLLIWANRVGLAGQTLDEARKGGADVGSFVHRMVEARIHGVTIPQPDEDMFVAAMSAYNAFTRWFDGQKFTVVATEVPLISEKYRYGGTIDSILRDENGALSIGDWKTSNAIYADYLLQLGAYGQLWDENASEDLRLTGGFHLCRFAKENGDFGHRHFPHLDDGLEMFLKLRECYELDKSLKRRAK